MVNTKSAHGTTGEFRISNLPARLNDISRSGGEFRFRNSNFEIWASLKNYSLTGGKGLLKN